jgi:AmpE protein
MTFLTILIALFIERVSQQHRPSRRHRWFDVYCRRLSGVGFLESLIARRWGALLLLLPPLLPIAWLQLTFADMGGPFALAFGALVLLMSLGPRDLGSDTEAFLEARDQGQDGRASELAGALCLSEPPDSEPRRSLAVARAVVVLAARRLVGPIFWFVLFGAVGAAAYRLIHLLAGRLQREPCPAGMRRRSDELRHIADWGPARISAAGYAIAGNFDAVAHAWRTFDYLPGDGPLSEAEQLLAQTGLAALDTFPDELEQSDVHAEGTLDASLIPPVVEDALALVWRSLAMWIAVIGGGSLVAALA